jgi:hypothetical protein
VCLFDFKKEISVCPIILSLPFLPLALFYFLPFRTVLPIYLLILLVTAFIYFKLIMVMKYKVQTGKEGMIGEEALVIEILIKKGRLRCGVRPGPQWQMAKNFKKSRR